LGDTLDLSAAPAGECHIWGWSYRGLDDPIMGDNISTLTDDACEAISDNFITIYREEPDGGRVSTTEGDTILELCVGEIVFAVQHETTAEALNYWYIITDGENNILEFHNPANGDTLDLSAAPAGICHIWGWNHMGLADPVAGENISTLADDFCEAISENWIVVNRVDSGDACGTSSVLQVESATGLNIFPNPASDVITVSYETLLDEKGTITLLDASGRTVMLENINKGENSHTLNTGELSNGLYFLKLNSGDGLSTRRIAILNR